MVVLSASMGSALPVGSLAFVVPQGGYFVGDVVTFKIPDLPAGRQVPDELLTHRIKSVKVSKCQCVTAGTNDGVRVYETQGDANNVVDDWELTSEQIVGKVIFHLPYLGYLLHLPQLLLTVVVKLINPTG